MTQTVMNATDISLLISGGTLILSVSATFFITGLRWGQMQRDVRSINDRLAKIEGMFTLRLRDHDQ